MPTNTPALSQTINQKAINNFPLVGRDAGELFKIMPGMAINSGGSQSTFNDRVVGSNNGPVGSYASNGTMPYGTTAYMLDGADLVDPGNFGTQIANINPDMISSVKLLLGNYSAKYAKGPTIFQAFSKSGGLNYHGEAYLYTRNSALDSVDAYTKSQGGTKKKKAASSASNGSRSSSASVVGAATSTPSVGARTGLTSWACRSDGGRRAENTEAADPWWDSAASEVSRSRCVNT